MSPWHRTSTRRKDVNPSMILEALAARDLIGLLDTVCQARGVTREEVCGRRRTKNVASARQELWWHLRRSPGMSYGEIGLLFGRNHTTVMAGIRAFERTRVDAAA